MLPKRFALLGLLFTITSLDSGREAFAQASIWNGYQGSSSVALSFVPGAQTSDPDLHFLGVSLSTGSPSAEIANGLGTEWTVDTGSTGVVITSDYLYAVYGIKASDLPETAPASITYSSSGLTYTGFSTTLNLGLYSASSTGTGTLGATARLPVIIATQMTDAGGNTTDFCTTGTGCAPTGQSLEQFGIGFGRGTGSSDTNPLLNLTSVSSGNLQTIAPGYVVSSQGIQLGLTSAQMQDTSFAGLLPSAATTSTSLTNAYAAAATATDWQTPPATITIHGASNAADNGTFYGSLLVDTGIANMELSTGGAYWNPTYNAANPSQSSSIAVYLPGVATSAQGQPLSYSLVYQGTCATGQGNCPPYHASASDLSPVYPINSANAPGNGIAFVAPTANKPDVYPFINTGTEFLNYFNIVYDPVSGFFGYQVAQDPTRTSNDPTVTSSIALQGATTIPDGTTVTVPTLLFAEFVDGYSGTNGAQTVAQLSSPGTVTMDGVISSAIICGTGGLNCAATSLELIGGRFIFAADNDYLGATAVDPGAALALTGSGSIASSAGLVDNGAFDVSGTLSGASLQSLTGSGAVTLGGQTLTLTNAAATFAGSIAGEGGLAVTGGQQVLSGVNVYTGATTVGAGATLALSGTGSIAGSNLVTDDGTLNLANTANGANLQSLAGSGTVALGGETLTLSNASGSFAGTIAGTGGLTLAAGREALSGVGSYTGTTTIAPAATLALIGDGGLLASPVNAQGTLDISATTNGATISSLAGTGSVNLGAQTLILGDASGTFAGTINGSGGVAILDGDETFTGANSYTGGTGIAAGATLAITSDGALGATSSPLLVNGGTLLALGNLTGTRTVLLGSGGGAINANGYEVTLGGLVLGTGDLTVTHGLVSINGLLAARSLAVASGATLRGIGTIDAPTTIAGTLAPGNSPGTLTFMAPVTLSPSATTAIDIDGTGSGTGAGNYSRVILTGANSAIAVGGALAPKLRGITGSASNGYTPPIGQSFQVIAAQGGVTGSFSGLVQPASGLSPGSRFDAIYGGNAVSLVVTPASYGNLAASGIAESSSESTLGTALDALRPAAGLAMSGSAAALYYPLYGLPASNIPPVLDAIGPTIYADALVTERSAWYLMSQAADQELASERGLTLGSAANTAPGPGNSTIWVTALAGYDSTNAAGAPGFTAGLGGAAAGLDAPVFDRPGLGQARLGLAVGTVDGSTWTTSGGSATAHDANLLAYGSWRAGAFFATAQLGGLYAQETVNRNLGLFAVSPQGSTNGLAGGGGVHLGLQEALGRYLLEPSLGFDGVSFHESDLTETNGGALTQTIGGQEIGSAKTTLGVSLQRRFAFSPTVTVVARGALGWSHEFASNTASVWAAFSGLNGSSYTVTSAPIGRDAALIGLVADMTVRSWPLSLFAGYGGAINGSSNAEAFNAGVKFIW